MELVESASDSNPIQLTHNRNSRNNIMLQFRLKSNSSPKRSIMEVASAKSYVDSRLYPTVRKMERPIISKFLAGETG